MQEKTNSSVIPLHECYQVSSDLSIHTWLHLQLYNAPFSKVNVRLLRLCFEIFQLLQNVGEVVLQIFLECDYVFSVNTKKTKCLVHWNRENSIT